MRDVQRYERKIRWYTSDPQRPISRKEPCSHVVTLHSTKIWGAFFALELSFVVLDIQLIPTSTNICNLVHVHQNKTGSLLGFQVTYRPQLLEMLENSSKSDKGLKKVKHETQGWTNWHGLHKGSFFATREDGMKQKLFSVLSMSKATSKSLTVLTFPLILSVKAKGSELQYPALPLIPDAGSIPALPYWVA